MVFAGAETFDKSEIAPNLVGISCWFDGKEIFPQAFRDSGCVQGWKKYSHVRWDDSEKNPALW